MTLCLETCPNNVVLTELGISIYKYVSQMLFPSEVCENRAFLRTDYLTQYSYTNAQKLFILRLCVKITFRTVRNSRFVQA